VLKDPYSFDFLTLAGDARERELEQGLLAHLRKFLLELGAGFAFVGEQHPLEVGGEDFHIDLLFYHLRLRCFVIIDLKMEPFKPEFEVVVEYSLRDTRKPIGVSAYRITERLPERLRGSLPTVEQLEAELAGTERG